ncbi:MAG: amino acid adenylation domain-containing protein, partial [Pseudomonas sp.]|uniref:amino acid adenylation domain-containing protein n=1 Tax=Pseudomonas sp. TaxID=306 RepID=UPI003C734A70
AEDWRETLTAHLQQVLPDYMVPNQWLLLDQMPLSPNGKLDRKALPKPDAAAQPAYVAPRSELEQRIASVWAEVLRVEQVGVTDNFFELGGDSIISIQVVGRARQAGIHFTPKELFQYQTVQGLAGIARCGETVSIVDQGPVSGSLALLPFQRWFFDSAMPEPRHWNQSVLLTSRAPMHAGLIEQALQALVQHHDALRLRFNHAADGWSAHHAPVEPLQSLLHQATLQTSDEIEAACDAAQRSLDIEHGPLLRGLLINLADGTQRLLLVIHHLAVDGVSWRVLLEDLQQAYQSVSDGKTVALAAKTTAFKTWAERLQAYAVGDVLRAESAWWQAQLKAVDAELPCKTSAAIVRNDQARTVHVQLGRDLTQRLLQQAPVAYRTQVNDLLLTALARVIGRWSEQASTLIQLEGHGREELFDAIDLSRTVGWFTTAFPVRLTPEQDLAGSIKRIKEQLRSVPNKGIGFGVLRYLADAQTQQVFSQLPQPRITFNYLGQLDSQFDRGALFAPAVESVGSEQSPLAPLANWLVLNGQVYDGQFSLGWTFSDVLFEAATVQRLADDYIVELTGLIEHCSDPAHGAVTPSDVPLAALTQAQLDALPVPCANIEDIYPLSPMQQGMLFHSLYQQGGGDYINQLRVNVQGLDVERFRAAWQDAVHHHDSLRSGFIWESEQQLPLQVVHRQAVVPFTVYDWQSRTDLADAVQQLADTQREQGFDLKAAPLLRLDLVRSGPDNIELIYTSHHILMDGWSNAQLLGEVLQRYSGTQPAARAGRYGDYIAWLQRQDNALGERFWKEQLAALEEPTRLASTLQSAQPSHGYADLYDVIDTQQTRDLEAFARRHKVTLNTVVQAAWALLLQRRTGQSTVAFGATVAGRPADVPGALQQVGLFINTLPVITSVSAECEVGEWLQALQSLNLRLREYEHTPLFNIQRWAGQGGEALFDSLLVFENYPVSQALEQGAPAGLVFGQVHSQEQSNYPLTLAVGLEERLSLHYSYDRQHFSPVAVEQVNVQLRHLLQQIVEVGAHGRVDEIDLFDTASRQLILKDWNPSVAAYAPTGCLHHLIETQVAKAPHAVALVCEGEQLTYAELNRRANRLAHALIASGVGPEVLVGIAVERSFEMLVGVLAILKAGGAYVPLDPAYPQERLQYMIEDSGLALLLTQEHLPRPVGVRSLLIGADYPAIEHNPEVAVGPENLAYVIYTSGSTGKPKGTLLPHSNVVRLFEATQGWFDFGAQDCWSLFHSYAFDFSVWEIFGALLYGGRLLIVPQDVSRSPQAFFDLLCTAQVTVLNQTPSAFKQLMQVACADQASRNLSLRYVVFGGEALDVNSLRPWFERFGDSAPQLINMYGITETTVHVTYRPLSQADLENDASSPIGVAIPDLSWYVLDRDLKPVPAGCIGELFIGGAGLARGYLNRADLSSTRFIPNLFSGTGDRLYRTGDLARYRADGVIDYVGRIDHQVKIRGFRIELGEIQARLLAQASVREAVVLAHEGLGGTQLVGYVVPVDRVDDAGAWRETLKAALREDLPEYMVPAHMLLLDRMPLTANGKLDRKALPEPDASLLQQAYVAPHSELEHKVAAVWAQVLGLERVGMGDNFFELGGHSLLATQAMLRLREQLGLDITIKTLFTTADLAEFCQVVQALEPEFEPIHDVLAKSMEALNRLSADELEKLIS